MEISRTAHLRPVSDFGAKTGKRKEEETNAHTEEKKIPGIETD